MNEWKEWNAANDGICIFPFYWEMYRDADKNRLYRYNSYVH